MAHDKDGVPAESAATISPQFPDISQSGCDVVDDFAHYVKLVNVRFHEISGKSFLYD
jgi:hypothetical protein